MVTGVHLPEGRLRVPRVVADVALPGGMTVRFSVVRQRGGRLTVREPETRDRVPAIVFADELRDAIAAAVVAAVRADPAAAEYLSHPPEFAD